MGKRRCWDFIFRLQENSENGCWRLNVAGAWGLGLGGFGGGGGWRGREWKAESEKRREIMWECS